MVCGSGEFALSDRPDEAARGSQESRGVRLRAQTSYRRQRKGAGAEAGEEGDGKRATSRAHTPAFWSIIILASMQLGRTLPCSPLNSIFRLMLSTTAGSRSLASTTTSSPSCIGFRIREGLETPLCPLPVQPLLQDNPPSPPLVLSVYSPPISPLAPLCFFIVAASPECPECPFVAPFAVPICRPLSWRRIASIAYCQPPKTAGDMVAKATTSSVHVHRLTSLAYLIARSPEAARPSRIRTRSPNLSWRRKRAQNIHAMSALSAETHEFRHSKLTRRCVEKS